MVHGEDGAGVLTGDMTYTVSDCIAVSGVHEKQKTKKKSIRGGVLGQRGNNTLVFHSSLLTFLTFPPHYIRICCPHQRARSCCLVGSSCQILAGGGRQRHVGCSEENGQRGQRDKRKRGQNCIARWEAEGRKWKDEE